MKAITIRIEDDLHKKTKHHLVDLNISFNAYVNNLIIEDLKKNNQ